MKNLSNWKNVALIVALIIIVWVFTDNRFKPADNSGLNNKQIEANRAFVINYQGQEGKSALELLKNQHQVETQPFGNDEFVQSINGIKPEPNQFWAFYVNGAQAQVGAGSYITKDGDQIEWKLESF